MQRLLDKRILRLRTEQWLFILSLLGMFAVMVCLFFWTPLISDDVLYNANENGDRVSGLGEIFRLEYQQYNTWGGRSVVHVLARFFLMINKSWFNVASAAVYIIFIWLQYRHINGSRRLHLGLWLFLLMANWYLLPIFKETVLWLTGSFNYLWGTTIILAFLLPFRLYAEDDTHFNKTRWQVIMPVAGFFAGWCSENTSGAGILFCLIAIGLVWLQKKRVPVWMLSSTAVAMVTFAIMLLAPGNRVRGQRLVELGYATTGFLPRLLVAMNVLRDNYLVILAVTAVLMAMMYQPGKPWREQARRYTPVAVYLVCGLAANFAMVFSPIYMLRNSFGVAVFFIMACGHALMAVVKDTAVGFRMLYASVVVGAMFWVFSLWHVVYFTRYVYVVDGMVAQQMEAARLAGTRDIVIEIDLPMPEGDRWINNYPEAMDYIEKNTPEAFARTHGIREINSLKFVWKQ